MFQKTSFLKFFKQRIVRLRVKVQINSYYEFIKLNNFLLQKPFHPDNDKSLSAEILNKLKSNISPT